MSTTLANESTELVRIADIPNAVDLFTKGGLHGVLDGIEAKVRAIPLDASTATGRAEIRSVAYQIARTKTALDEEGKKLTEEWRRGTALVNEERRKSIERLDKLKDEIRKPLTDFEERDKRRISEHEAALAELQPSFPSGFLFTAPSSQIAEELERFSKLHRDRNFEEFSERATKARQSTLASLVDAYRRRQLQEQLDAELVRHRAEEAKRLQQEREDQIKREAAEAQRIESERLANEAAKAERLRVEREAARVAKEAADRLAKAEADRKAVEEKAAAERKRAADEKARLAKEAADKVAEAEARAKKAAADLKAANERAKREAEAATQRERDRAEIARRAEEAEKAKREADKANRTRIRLEIIADLMPAMANDGALAKIAEMLMAGEVRNVSVRF